MADAVYPPTPGSRAIRIPLSRMSDDKYTPSPSRRTNRDATTAMHRTDSTDGSEVSASSSRTRNALLKTGRTVASPTNTNIRTPLPGAAIFVTPEQPSQRKDKQKATDLPPPESVPERALHNNSLSYSSPLSPSMLSSGSYKSINLNSHMSSDPDDPQPARLITYTKHSQGFTWNDELFLPSYLMGRRYGGRGSKGRRRWGGGYGGEDEDDEMDGVGDFDEEVDRCPITEIFVTDEEAAAMLP